MKPDGQFECLKKGQLKWSEVSLDHRIACLQKFSELLESNREELARDLSQEVGKPIREARNEINGARTRLQFFLDHSRKTLSPETVNSAPGLKEIIALEPLGVIANISAWNYPYLIAMNVLPPALIAGNAVLYKPSEFATRTGVHIRDLLYEAGIPKDVLQTATGGAKMGATLLRLPFDGFFFTGSYRTGQAIAAKLAGRLVPVVLELGGKDPLYVTDDVDIAWAAANAVEGAFYNCGQSCCAVERIYVHEKIHDAFVEAFVNETLKLKLGDPLDESTTLGRLTRKAQVILLSAQVKDAVRRGARLLTGGKPVAGKGSFFQPTVLTRVNHSMRVMKEETFGPVIGIQKVKTDAEALRLMQDTEYGLTAAVFSRNEERAVHLLRQIDAGTGYWNCCDRVSPYLPWAGRKHSGIGATLSYQGIRSFARPKAYHLKKN